MNLENLDLVELNAQEVKEVDGGLWMELFIASGPVGWVNGGLFALGVYNGYNSN